MGTGNYEDFFLTLLFSSATQTKIKAPGKSTIGGNTF